MRFIITEFHQFCDIVERRYRPTAPAPRVERNPRTNVGLPVKNFHVNTRRNERNYCWFRVRREIQYHVSFCFHLIGRRYDVKLKPAIRNIFRERTVSFTSPYKIYSWIIHLNLFPNLNWLTAWTVSGIKSKTHGKKTNDSNF